MQKTNPFLNDLRRMISVDVETAGPSPSGYALLSIGACTLFEPRQTFYVELKPVSLESTSRAMAVHKLDLEELARKGKDPEEAMAAFEAWLDEMFPGDACPLFLGFNAPFDWMFVADYFHRFLGRNPFGHSAVDLKAFVMGLLRVPWEQTRMAALSDRPLRHNALEDALDQADLFLYILRGEGYILDNKTRMKGDSHGG